MTLINIEMCIYNGCLLRRSFKLAINAAQKTFDFLAVDEGNFASFTGSKPLLDFAGLLSLPVLRSDLRRILTVRLDNLSLTVG